MFPRLYFLVGDVVSTAVIGALVAAICYAVLPAGWHTAVAMLPGMTIGMFVPVPLCLFLFGRFWGAMELMLPCMLGGMLSGMWAGMAVTMTELSWPGAMLTGAAIAWAALLFCYAVNALETWRAQRNG